MDLRLIAIFGWFGVLLATLITFAAGKVGAGFATAALCIAYLLVLKRSWGVVVMAVAGQVLGGFGRFVALHPLGSWLAGSVIAFGVAASFGLWWFAAIAFFSGVAAVISMTNNGWKIARGRVKQGFVITMKLLFGLFGAEKAIMAWLAMLFLSMAGTILTGGQIGKFFELRGFAFALLFVIGFPIALWHINKKIIAEEITMKTVLTWAAVLIAAAYTLKMIAGIFI